MKTRNLLVGVLSLATIGLSTPALADPVDDYTLRLSRQLGNICATVAKTESEYYQCMNATVSPIQNLELEQAKDKGCLQERQSYQEFGWAISSECQKRLAAWDKKHAPHLNR